MAKKATLPTRKRPNPPSILIDGPALFQPAPELKEWVVNTFVDPKSNLFNPDHEHLLEADIGFLWTNVSNARQMRTVVGTAEDPTPTNGGKWKNGRASQQLIEWFGEVPDFLITLYAPILATVSDRTFCAVIEHELYHCAQQKDEFGSPKFRQDGRPAFCMRGHDVEEFIGVAARYGMTPELTALFTAVKDAIQLPDDLIETVCGTCSGRAS